MRTLTKATALLLSALLSVGVLAACDSDTADSDSGKKDKEEKIPTVEEVFNIFHDTKNGQLDMEIATSAEESGISMSMTVKMMIETADMHSHATMNMDMSYAGSNTNTTSEFYTDQSDGKNVLYMKDDATGLWTTTENTGEVEEGVEDADEMVSGYKDLFNSAFYGEFDKEARRYVMKEGEKASVTVEGQNAEFYDAYIEVAKDGSYTLFAKYSVQGAEATLTLKLSRINQVTVTLPEVAG